MAYTAHLVTASSHPEPRIMVRDDRDGEISDVLLSATATLDEADTELRSAGWARHAEWSTAKDGWLAPIVPA